MRSITVRASSRIVISSERPTLNAAPRAPSSSISMTSARVVSWTWPKQRDWLPSP